MGYDLHITRKANWSDPEGPTIGEQEWRDLIEAEARLEDELRFEEGEITAKNPDKALIGKMVRIAGKLNATVQGEDGELYRENGTSYEPAIEPEAPKGLIAHVKQWWRVRRILNEGRKKSGFRVGARVKDPWGKLGTITKVDWKANSGLGIVTVRMDDGRVTDSWSCVMSGLEVAEE